MTEPTTSYMGVKIASMIGGFFGGAAILTFIKPKSIGEAFIRGGVSVGTAIIFSSPLLELTSMKASIENYAMSGFIVGFLAYSVLGMIANFLHKHQNSDIVSVVNDIRGKKD